MTNAATLPTLLLVEPQFVLRRTIVAVAHDLGIALFREAAGTDLARQWLASQRFDGIVIDVCGAPATFDLLSRLRQGVFASDPGTPILAMTSMTAGDGRRAWLESLGSSSILRRPFKVAELLRRLPLMKVCAEA